MKRIALLLVPVCFAAVLGACQDHHFTAYDPNNPIDPKSIGSDTTKPIGHPPAPTPAPARASSSGSLLTGTIELAPETTANPDWTLYIIVRPVAGGPPVAAAMSQQTEFPYRFKITRDHLMSGEPEPGVALLVSARLDSDGDPMTKDPSDLTGAAPEPVGIGAVGLVVTISAGGK